MRPCDFRWGEMMMIFWYKPPPRKLLIGLREDESRMTWIWPRIFCTYFRVIRDSSSRSPITSLRGGRFVLKFVAI